ncbi:MAG: hypothetical protein RL033_7963 [Pseudomonadota bacterium]
MNPAPDLRDGRRAVSAGAGVSERSSGSSSDANAPSSEQESRVQRARSSLAPVPEPVELGAAPRQPSVAGAAAPTPASKRGLSIAQKLGLLMFVLVLAIVAPLTAYFQSQQVESLRQNLQRKADTYAQLLSTQVRSAVAFDDRETAREAFEALATDRDLSGVVLFTGKGTVLERWGSLSNLAQDAKSGVTERHVFQLPDRVLAVAPVVSLEGPKGTLALELSKAELERGRSEVQRTSLIMGSLALVVGVLLALAIAQSFARRLRAIASVAGLVAAGDLTQTVSNDDSRDEIGSLSRSFGTMLEQLKRLIAEIKTSAEQEQARLEGLVDQRTRALVSRNEDMRRVLDNVDQGFLTIDRNGKMSEERSAIIGRWLGTVPASGVLWDYIAQAAPSMALPLSIGWDQVVEDILPLEVSVQMMPRSFVIGSRHYAIDYKPTQNESGALEGMLIVLSDVTVVVERERLEEEEREVLQLFSRVLQDRAGVLEFLGETQRLVELVTRHTPTDIDVTKRLLHTLKGNAGLYGLQSIAKLCHSVEDNMQEQGGNLSRTDADRLLAFWQAMSAKLGSFIDAPKNGGVTIDDAEYGELLAAVAGGMPHAQLAGIVGAWQLEPVELRLRRLAQQAQGLAERLQKLPLEVRVDAGRLRIDSTRLTDVWATLPHLVRNAVDHGIESPEQRADAGKPERASLVLRASLSAQQFSIEIEDSGRGIDWDALRAAAQKKGLPCGNQRELSEALFADGVSTRDEVTENSGRGVGTAALARAVKTTGGRIEVQSERGKGTRFRLTWPAAVARPSLVKAIPGGFGSPGAKNGMGLRS